MTTRDPSTKPRPNPDGGGGEEDGLDDQRDGAGGDGSGPPEIPFLEEMFSGSEPQQSRPDPDDADSSAVGT